MYFHPILPVEGEVVVDAAVVVVALDVVVVTGSGTGAGPRASPNPQAETLFGPPHICDASPRQGVLQSADFWIPLSPLNAFEQKHSP
jgi:hypothetical protein